MESADRHSHFAGRLDVASSLRHTAVATQHDDGLLSCSCRRWMSQTNRFANRVGRALHTVLVSPAHAQPSSSLTHISTRVAVRVPVRRTLKTASKIPPFHKKGSYFHYCRIVNDISVLLMSQFSNSCVFRIAFLQYSSQGISKLFANVYTGADT